MDLGERIDVSGVVGQLVLGSEEASTSVSFLLYGAAELGALESNGRLTSTNEILSAVAARLVAAAAAADQAHQHPGYAAGPIWTAHSLLRAARTLADLHEGCERSTVARLDLLLESMRGGDRGAHHLSSLTVGLDRRLPPRHLHRAVGLPCGCRLSAAHLLLAAKVRRLPWSPSCGIAARLQLAAKVAWLP